MYSKKAVSGHIEIIISFIIFLGFVSFLLFFINPIEKSKETTHYLDMAEKAIVNYLAIDITSFSVTVTDNTVLPPMIAGGAAVQCFCFLYNAPKLAAIDETGKFAKARTIPSSKVCVEPTVDSSTGTAHKFYKLYFSNAITEDTGLLCGVSDVDLTADKYRLGVMNEYKLISKVNLNTMNSAYTGGAASYDNLKTSLRLETDFNIVIKDMGGNSLVTLKNKEPPKSSNVMAKEIPIEIMNETGGIIPATMNLQVWE